LNRPLACSQASVEGGAAGGMRGSRGGPFSYLQPNAKSPVSKENGGFC
jgi:hypothetical protein